MMRTATNTLRIAGLAIFLAWVFLVAYMFGAASSSHAAEVTPNPTQSAPNLEHRRNEPQTTVADVSRTVMCPTCDTTLDQSHSPAAERMRVWVQTAVANGWTRDEIQAGLVKEYGGSEAILAVPRARGIGIFAWLVPLLVVLAAATYGVLLVRRWRRAQLSREVGSQSSSSAA